jgi:hypothetical protein
MVGRSRAGPPSPLWGRAPRCAGLRGPPRSSGRPRSSGFWWRACRRGPAVCRPPPGCRGPPLRFKGILLHDDARQLRRRRVGRIPIVPAGCTILLLAAAPPLTSPRTQRRLCSSGAPAESAGDLCKKDQRQMTMRLSRLMQKFLDALSQSRPAPDRRSLISIVADSPASAGRGYWPAFAQACSKPGLGLPIAPCFLDRPQTQPSVRKDGPAPDTRQPSSLTAPEFSFFAEKPC